MKRNKVAAESLTVTGKRKSREDWIAAARKVLVKSGVDSVKVDRLANDLRATRGSFYWHFTDRDELLNALLHDWEVNNYVAISTIRARWASSKPDLTELIEWWVGEGTESPAFGMAIRTWARGDADVEDVMHRVDNEWINLVQLLFSPEIYDESERLVRARVVYFHQVGYHALAMREPQEERLRLIPYYYKVLTGREAGDNLLNALRAMGRAEPVAPGKTRGAKAAAKETSRRRKKS